MKDHKCSFINPFKEMDYYIIWGLNENKNNNRMLGYLCVMTKGFMLTWN